MKIVMYAPYYITKRGKKKRYDHTLICYTRRSCRDEFSKMIKTYPIPTQVMLLSEFRIEKVTVTIEPFKK